MLDHEDSRFGLALYALQLKVHEIEGTLVVSIPLDPLSKLADAPLGSQTHIEFRLDRRTQTLTVSRPEGMWEKGDKLVRGAAKTYAWKGGLPQLMKNGSIWPPHPAYGERELDELPILCSLRFIVHRAGLWEKRDAETEAAASRLWKAVWRILYTAMNERAHSRAVRFGLSWDEYQVLHRRPDLCDFLERYPRPRQGRSGPEGRPADPRWTNSYFRGWCAVGDVNVADKRCTTSRCRKAIIPRQATAAIPLHYTRWASRIKVER